jgi:hypothetical protein
MDHASDRPFQHVAGAFSHLVRGCDESRAQGLGQDKDIAGARLGIGQHGGWFHQARHAQTEFDLGITQRVPSHGHGAGGLHAIGCATEDLAEDLARDLIIGKLATTRILSATLRRVRGEAGPLRHRERYRLHIGAAEVGATVSLLEGNELTGSSPMLGQLFLTEPVMAVHGQLFVLRSESPPSTLGGGLVIQPLAGRIRRRDTAVHEAHGCRGRTASVTNSPLHWLPSVHALLDRPILTELVPSKGRGAIVEAVRGDRGGAS